MLKPVKASTLKHKDLYHISFSKHTGNWFYPKAPNAQPEPKVKHSKVSYPEYDKARVCFSPTILQCFQAIYANFNERFEIENEPFLYFYVYKAKLAGGELVYTPEILTSNKLVYDAHVTEEYDVLEACKIELVSKIKIFNPKDEKDLMLYPYNDKSLPQLYLAPANVKWTVVKSYKTAVLEEYLKW